MSTSLRQRKLEQQRERQLSRQQQRRQNMTNNASLIQNSSEQVEYIGAYDNPSLSLTSESPKGKPKKSKKKKQQQQHNPESISQLIDIDDDFDPLALSTQHKPKKIVKKKASSSGDENNSTPTHYDQARQQQNNEDLFNLSDASSESNFSMRDDISLAGGPIIRPQTAQSNYPKQDNSAVSASSFERLPSVNRSASSIINRITQRSSSKTNIHPSSTRHLSSTSEKFPNKKKEVPTLSSLYSKSPTQDSPYGFIPGMAHIKSIEEFAFAAAPWEHKDGTAIRSRITRDKRGGKFGNVRYYMHLEMPGGGSARQFVLAARKRTRAKTSNYLISTDVENINRESSNIIGKLRSNALGTRFVSFDNGVAANTTEAMRNANLIRREMCMVLYETNILGFHGPRRMTVVIPGMQEGEDGEKERCECRPITDTDSMSAKFDARKLDDFICLENKKPVWNQDTQSFVLNFHGRVTMASVKNFQIIHKDNPNYIIMQFGRISEDIFTIDYRYPLSAFQAFSIALSSFDSKLACE